MPRYGSEFENVIANVRWIDFYQTTQKYNNHEQSDTKINPK